jgi:DNA-binding beta-propeller fold protein YncE
MRRSILGWPVVLLLGILVWPQLGIAQKAMTANDGHSTLVKGELVLLPQGQDTISILDTSTDSPKVVTIADVGNSIFGPPTNLVMTPDERMALVAEAVTVVEEKGKPTIVKTDQVHVIDLSSSPPRKISSVKVGLQPSGMALSPDGQIALVCNRAGNSISVLRIDGMNVKNVSTVDIGDMVTHVAFTPDGNKALFNRYEKASIGILNVRGTEVISAGVDIPVGRYPYSFAITPDGTLALVPNMGSTGRSDGHMGSLTVIDLSLDPPRVIDTVTVGDTPEGIAVSPDGSLAVTGELGGADATPDAWFYNELSTATVLKIKGKEVRPFKTLKTGRIGESVAFTPDGRYLLIANLLDNNVMAFAVQNGEVKEPPMIIKVGFGPGAMRTVIPYGKP